VQKAHYDKAHRAVSYVVGDWVWLRLRHRAAASLPSVTKGKLKSRFYEPYRISELINNVAVRLALPARARLHDVFHVRLLKKFVGTPPDAPPPLPPVHHGAAVPEPERAVRARLARGVRQILIHWKGEPASAATWEDLDSFRERRLSSSRTSCSSRGGEMSCGASTIGGTHVHSRRRQQIGPARG